MSLFEFEKNNTSRQVPDLINYLHNTVNHFEWHKTCMKYDSYKIINFKLVVLRDQNFSTE
jgi:hypothetical protein